jgi:RNA polymerase sigma-70 factor, ECF subfamily
LRLGPDDARRFREGDAGVFRRVVDGCSPRLLAVTRSFAADDDEAHDLLQETWRRAWTRRETFRAAGSVQSWLYAVCRSVCLSRHAKRREAIIPAVAVAASAPVSASPEAAAERSELRAALHVALMELPDRERDVAWLRLVDGLSTRETADALGIAEGTVKATLHHSIRKLRSSMEQWK